MFVRLNVPQLRDISNIKLGPNYLNYHGILTFWIPRVKWRVHTYSPRTPMPFSDHQSYTTMYSNDSVISLILAYISLTCLKLNFLL